MAELKHLVNKVKLMEGSKGELKELELEKCLNGTFKMAPVDKLESAVYLWTYKQDVMEEAEKCYILTALANPGANKLLEDRIIRLLRKYEGAINSFGTVRNKEDANALDRLRGTYGMWQVLGRSQQVLSQRLAKETVKRVEEGF